MNNYYDLYNIYIEHRLDDGKTYDEIAFFCKTSLEDAEKVLLEMKDEEDWDPSLTLEAWQEHVKLYRKNNPRPIILSSGTVGDPRRPPAKINPESVWVSLKNTLSKQGISEDSLKNIYHSADEVYRRLTPDSRESGPVKGLVFGSVQSGKTANMEALLALAADSCWNVFVIFTGTIESLRLQNMKRFERDLPDTSHVYWTHLDFSGDDKNFHASNLKLNASDSSYYAARYVITCLKQSSRIEKLINWLYSDSSKTGRVRLVVIDDEADQAGVNTARILPPKEAEEYEQERRKINSLLVRLANGRTAKGEVPKVPLQAINYISFTATPYANVLNEPPGESLYPKNFVHALEDPREYFGCNVIFGNPDYRNEKNEIVCPGLDVVRNIPPTDALLLKKNYKGEEWAIPDSMADSLCWFLYAAAALRCKKRKKPISMLIHNSSAASAHFDDFEMVKAFLTETPKGVILQRCKALFEEEKDRFTFEDFRQNFSCYGSLQNVDREYLDFESVREEIALMLSEVGNMRIEDEGELLYSTGLNLCVDNYQANRKGNETGVVLRAIYPDDEQLAAMDKAPVFIVIGGNTLSRGLTIEGLVCSYFTRNSTQADTLMQMGRWFGYRFGYELYQRIWLTPEVKNKYRALAKADMELKKEIKRFEEQHLLPENLGIKVSTMPDVSRFMPTSKNKMQSAEACGLDYSGYSEELTEFDFDDLILKKNLIATESFLRGLETPCELGNAVVWKNLKRENVLSYIRSIGISAHSSLSDALPSYLQWLEDSKTFLFWNVAVPGKRNSPQGTWSIGEIKLGRVERSRKKGVSDHIDIGSLRDGLDAICDVDEGALNGEQKKLLKNVRRTRKNILESRAQLGLENTPLLLIYRIDKESKSSEATRVPLGVNEDIIGFSIIIPGEKAPGGSKTALWVNLTE